MADFFTAFPAQGIKPQEGISLGDMVSIARGAQELQQAQQMNPLLLQRAQEALGREKVERRIAEQTEKPRVSEAESRSAQAGFQSNTAGIENLRTHLANSSRELLGLLNRPELTPEDISSSIRKTMERAKAPENVIEQGLTEVPKAGTTMELKAWVARHATNALTAEAQLDKLFPAAQMVSTGATITPMTGGSPQLATTPPGTIAGPSTMVQLPPGARYELSGRTDINNNPTVFVKDASGKIIGETTVPAGVSPGQLSTGSAPTQIPAPGQPSARPTGVPPASASQPPINAPIRIPAGETAESGTGYRNESIAARGQVQPAGVAINNIRTIRQYLPLAQTGKYSESIAGLQSVLGNVAGSKPEELASAARDIIEKNIADLALQKNSALGGRFAADLSAVQTSLASAGKNPTAIAKVMDQLEPLMQHVQNYSTGLDKAIQNSPYKQYAKPEYDRKMNEAFDIRALMMKNAFDNGGPEGLSKWLKENNVNLREQQNLLKKLQQYKKLVDGEL